MPANDHDTASVVDQDAVTARSARFDIAAIAASLPESAQTLLVDHRMTDREAASARVFRVYAATPPHYHTGSDEYLYVVSGRGSFWMEDPAHIAEFRPAQLLFFEKGVVHAMPALFEGPVVFLAIDTPRRDPNDIIFVDPASGTPEGFIAPRG